MLAGKGIFMIAFNLAAAPKAQGKAKALVLQNCKALRSLYHIPVCFATGI